MLKEEGEGGEEEVVARGKGGRGEGMCVKSNPAGREKWVINEIIKI